MKKFNFNTIDSVQLQNIMKQKTDESKSLPRRKRCVKTTGILIVLLLTLFNGQLFSQEADEKVKQLLNNNDYFTLEQQFPALEKEMKDVPLKWIAKYILNLRFNRPDDALIAFSTLFNQHKKDVNVNQIIESGFSFFSLLELHQEYQPAYIGLQSLIKELSPYFSNSDAEKFNALQKHLFFLKDEKKMQVTIPENGGQIPFGHFEIGIPNQNNEFGNSMIMMGIVKVKIAGKEYIFLFDTGLERTLFFNHIADSMNLKQIENAYTIRGLSGNETANLAILQDSLLLGDIKFTNVPIYTCDNYWKKSLPNVQGDLNMIGGIIGIDLIRKLREIQILPNEKKILVPKKESEQPDFGKNILFDGSNLIIVQTKINSEPVNMMFDTGSNLTRLFKPYYLKREEKIKSDYQKGVNTDFGMTLQQNNTYQIPLLQIEVGNSKTSMENIPIYPEIFQQFNWYIDGLLGMDFLLRSKKITLNMNKMFMDIE